MTKPLRSIHLRAWSLLALLVPAGILSAYLAVPQKSTSQLLQHEHTTALPVLAGNVERNDYTVSLRCSAEKNQYQLQWTGHATNTIPSLLIYRLRGTEAEIIGRTGPAGSYFFPLEKDSLNTYCFTLYDIIHRHVTDTIKFNR